MYGISKARKRTNRAITGRNSVTRKVTRLPNVRRAKRIVTRR
jgi:hypothetical protein